MTEDTSPPKRKKGIYIGAPACFKLEMACKQIRDAFSDGCQFDGMYVVGSCLERPDWRDVDVRYMLDDDAFRRLFPNAGDNWEFRSTLVPAHGHHLSVAERADRSAGRLSVSADVACE